MADHPRARPLSPHLTIYRWPVTMATSIVHRITGVGLSAGGLLLTWWLAAVASGPEAYQTYVGVASSPLGELILFGFAWALSYHLVNGIRHLAWDMGYGFDKGTANGTGIAAIAISFVLAIAAFAIAFTGHGGYNI